MEDLINYGRSVHSQSGEDGIIQKIFDTIGEGSKWCVEFGAWDGIHLSNTRALIDRGWKGALIEYNSNKYQELVRNTPRGSIPIHAKVGWGPTDGLDAILSRYPEIPLDFELVSIDIDSDDYSVWEAFTKYKPKVVIIEANPTFPINVEFVQMGGSHFGNSALSLYLLGISKGYRLVSYMTNCIFVRDDLADAFPKRSFAYIYYIGSSYHGAVVSGFSNQNYMIGNEAFGRVTSLGNRAELAACARHFHIRSGREMELLFN